MEGFGYKVEEVLEGIGVFYVCGGVVFLWVDEVGEFESILDEEDGCVVIYYVLVVFFCVEFDGEFMWILCCVGEFRFFCYGWLLFKYGCFFVDFV